jgi:hypothetical protein
MQQSDTRFGTAIRIAEPGLFKKIIYMTFLLCKVFDLRWLPIFRYVSFAWAHKGEPLLIASDGICER